MLRGRLWAEGVFAVVAFEHHVGNNWLYSTALSGARVLVRRADGEAARSIERLCRAGEFQRLLEAELGDLDERRCPHCGAADCWKRRPIFQGLLAIAALFLAGLLPPWQWIYYCNVCGTKFRQRYGLIGKASGFALAMEFADASLADVPEMQQLQESMRENWPMERPDEGHLDPALIPSEDRRGWICRIDGALRGFSLAERGTATLAALCVDMDFVRNGIGRRLHNAAVDWLFANGAEAVWTVAAPFTKAHKFFSAAGWKLTDMEDNGDYRLELGAEVWRVRRNKF